MESCYDPIIQSGGKYDIKLSAVSDEDNLSSNVILCSLGARYRNYCSTLSRTFLVDAPPRIEKTYSILIGLYNACLEKMVIGNELKDVYEGARAYLKNKDPALLSHLPKNLGFAIGLEFRDSTLVLNQTNNTPFSEGMVFNLSVGLHNIPLSEEDKASAPEAVKALSVFSLLVSDMVVVLKEGVPDILTKISKEYADISYSIGDQVVALPFDLLDVYISYQIPSVRRKKAKRRNKKRKSPRKELLVEAVALVRRKKPAKFQPIVAPKYSKI